MVTLSSTEYVRKKRVLAELAYEFSDPIWMWMVSDSCCLLYLFFVYKWNAIAIVVVVSLQATASDVYSGAFSLASWL